MSESEHPRDETGKFTDSQSSTETERESSVENSYARSVDSFQEPPKTVLARRTTGREVLCGGLLTGLATGLAWSSVVELFSRDQSFSGTEFLTSLVVPGLVAVVVWKLWRTGPVFGVIVAYLTLLIPLIGIGMGGANVLEATFAGAIAGIVYGSPWAIWRAFRRPADHGGSAESVPTLPGSDELEPTAMGFEIDGGVSPDE